VPTDFIIDRADGPDRIEPDADLQAALKALPDKQRQSVAYHYLGGLPYAEVASILGGTAEAARRAAADGIATLRRSTVSATSRNTERAADEHRI
jgi:DNA-directed RNA polymerase specialized sigma24 family protein